MTLNAHNLKRGGRYNWKHQAERLVYMGFRRYPNDQRGWHQFALVEKPDVVWCEVLGCDLDKLEETKEAQS